ncbi:MAG: Crp/Fnr family transcriptional regulator [Rhizorhabdus sp.]
MAVLSHAGIGNQLLRLLAEADFALLAPHLERVELEVSAVLTRVGEPIDMICFPEGGVIGFADVLGSGERLAVALTGREGFVGWPLVLGNDRWPHEAIVRAERCTALRIEAAVLLSIMRDNDRIRRLLLGYTSSLTAQMARTIVSNLIHPVEARTARWLLLYHDRVTGDEIAITHEELGVMLGVRRSSITDALHQLEGTGALRGHRGRVTIRDRARLEALAGETYGFAEAEYARLLAPDLQASAAQI